MPELFKDNLPLDGIVQYKGRSAVYFYMGYLGSDPQQCCIRRGRSGKKQWVDRSKLSVPAKPGGREK